MKPPTVYQLGGDVEVPLYPEWVADAETVSLSREVKTSYGSPITHGEE